MAYGGSAVGYESGMHPKQAWEDRQRQAEATEKEAYARATLGVAKQAMPVQSEVERALTEQSEKVERLAHVISRMLARLSPVLMDCPPSPDKEACVACQPYSTEIARAIDARSCNIASLTEELRAAESRLGI